MLGHFVRECYSWNIETLLMRDVSLRRTENQWRRHPRSEWSVLRFGLYSMSTYRSTVLATQAIANVVKTSFGPSGLDKMMVDDIGVCSKYCTDRHG